MGLEGRWSLDGANEWPVWENESREDSHRACLSRGVWNGPVPAGAPMDGCLGLCWRSGRLRPYNCHTLWDLSREAWPVHLRLVRPNFLQWLQPPRPLPLSSPAPLPRCQAHSWLVPPWPHLLPHLYSAKLCPNAASLTTLPPSPY